MNTVMDLDTDRDLETDTDMDMGTEHRNQNFADLATLCKIWVIFQILYFVKLEISRLAKVNVYKVAVSELTKRVSGLVMSGLRKY
jgi:hypothetical protein